MFSSIEIKIKTFMDSNDFCCNICEEHYDSTFREPLILQCGHTFCAACLSSIFARGNYVCPEDRGALTINRLSDLPKNYALLRMIPKSLTKLNQNSCFEHKKQLDYICLEDKQKVCANCVLFGIHKGHEIKQINELIKEYRIRSRCLLDMLNIIDKIEISKLENDLKDKMETICDKFKYKKIQIENEIQVGFNKIKYKIEEIEKDTLRILENNYEIIEDQIHKIKEIARKIIHQKNV